MTPAKLLTIRIAELTEQHGSLRAAARAIRIDPAYLLRLATGEKSAPSPGVLKRMGLKAITIYERLK